MTEQSDSSFLDHLEALRNVLLKIAGLFLLLCIPAWYFSGDVLQLLLNYAAPPGFKLHYFTVMEPFMTQLKISLILALTASLPLSLWWLWKFIAPGLTEEEQQKLRYPFFMILFLALAGAAVTIFFIIPALIRFSLSFAGDTIAPVIGIGDFVSMILVVILAGMAMFQFPLVLLGLLTTGILQIETVKQKRPHIVVTIFILAAIFSPPDVFSQLLLAIPTYLLFEASLLFFSLRKARDDSYEKIYKDTE
ncbi:MAG: twin-arginine translocase subunit TatC [Lentisphaeria bacterium]|nr:twin-arginine translocase subunit TatC [Lentisphaeria bacterium]